jgi:selenocysteine lyase/cysteine desulfurase
VAFTIAGWTPDQVATELASEKIAVWAGHSYAVEVVDQLGLADQGGVVRAGVVRYVEPDDVTALLVAVERLATRTR